MGFGNDECVARRGRFTAAVCDAGVVVDSGRYCHRALDDMADATPHGSYGVDAAAGGQPARFAAGVGVLRRLAPPRYPRKELDVRRGPGLVRPVAHRLLPRKHVGVVLAGDWIDLRFDTDGNLVQRDSTIR